MAQPKVSIGMPVFNGERSIQRSLDSLLAQSFTDFELIVSDNASSDGTESIVTKYAAVDTRIRYHRQTDNLGAAGNFQYVLDQSVGEYFMWAAADDFWSPLFVETCHKLLIDEPRARMAITAYECVSTTSCIFNRRFSNHLRCIEHESNSERVRQYAKLNWGTHKDNLVYGMWRRSEIVSIQNALQEHLRRGPIIGGVMNEYALALYRGAYSPDVMFYKCYPHLPPGHVLGPLLKPIVTAFNILRRKKPTRPKSTPARQQLENLTKAMQLAGFEETLVDEIVELNRSYSDLRHIRPHETRTNE